MSGGVSVNIVVTAHNSAAHIDRLLTSLAAQSLKDFTCIVVDDASEDGTPDLVREKHPWVTLIAMSRNRGPAHNRNVGIAKGRAPFIALFDDDAYLEDPHWLAKALEFMGRNPAVGQLATMILGGFDREMVLDCGIVRSGPLFMGRFHRKRLTEIGEAHLHAVSVLGACTAGTFLRREAVARVGGFDERYYCLAEDTDLSARIQLAGWDVIYHPGLVTYHHESQSMSRRERLKRHLFYRNNLLLLWESFSLRHATRLSLRALLLIARADVLWLWCLAVRHPPPEGWRGNTGPFIYAALRVLVDAGRICAKRRAIDRYRIRPRSHLEDVAGGEGKYDAVAGD